MIKIKKGARMGPQLRKEHILKTAIELALKIGYTRITCEEIAKNSQCAYGLVWHYFGGINELKQAIINHAMKQEILPILAEELSFKGKYNSQLTPDLKQKVINYLTE